MSLIKEYEDIRMSWPQNFIINGSSNNGKSSWCYFLIRDLSYCMKNVPKDVRLIYIFNVKQWFFEDLKKRDIKIEFFRRFDDPVLLDESYFRDSFVVVDDCLDLAPKGWAKNIYTKAAHGYNFSIASIIHNLYDPTIPDLRTINLNAGICVFLSSPRALSSVHTFARQTFTGNVPFFLSVYHQLTKKSYGYLLTNLSPSCPSELRLQSCIFEFEKPLTVFINYKDIQALKDKKDEETD